MFSGPLEKNSNPSLHNPWSGGAFKRFQTDLKSALLKAFPCLQDFNVLDEDIYD